MVPTNTAALSRLMTAERSSLLRFAARLVGWTAAEDITQSLYVRVQRIDDDPPIANKRSYLFRLARNLAVDHIRGEGRYNAMFEAGVDTSDIRCPEPIVEARLLDREKLELIAAAIERMPLRCRQVFVLVKFDELSVAETAQRLGISEDMVRKHIRHALQLCHHALSDEPA